MATSYLPKNDTSTDFKINSKEVLYSSGSNDECYTPAYAVEPILEFLPQNAIVWCPFDTKESQFVKLISKTNKVIHSHISEGKDFFHYEPKKWDIMISNPPFTDKRKTFERALSFGKPFALIMSNTWLNDSAPKQLFEEKDLQLLMFDKRMRFILANGKENSKITFSSSYFCWNFLPKQIVMRKLKIIK
ncbi:MAG: sugar-phosphate nucleotidyltransferase [Sulfurospirillaceae bacterium]|nr:sugar-phosphate nucleotidyltransferase [Sulfurospirillaceae bacterium]